MLFPINSIALSAPFASRLLCSRDLSDPQQRKVYDAETYKIAPGANQPPAPPHGPDQGVVLGALRDSGGTEPHPKPERPQGAQVPKAKDRFSAEGGIYSSFGSSPR